MMSGNSFQIPHQDNPVGPHFMTAVALPCLYIHSKLLHFITNAQ
jgi:hypothetical protein